MQKTKKSLVASGLALVVCLAMLIGTTFAWFTDSVTNKGNHIQAGTLDVTFQQLNTETNEYEDITGPVFNYDKWEPGYTYVSAFKIGNNGSLALKYQLDFVPQGEVSKLAEVIDVYYTASNDAITELPDSVENMTKVGTLADVLAQEDGAAHGHLSAGQADYAAVALHMQETAGNEYQGLSIGTEFDIVLKATQYTEETDGFGSPDYDADAPYLPVSTADEFVQTVESASADEVVRLTENVTIKNRSIPLSRSGRTHIDLNGCTLTVQADLESDDQVRAQLTNGEMIIENGKIAVIDNKGDFPLASSIEVHGNSSLFLKNVEFTVEGGHAFLVQEQGLVNITDSFIKADGYCVSTNASALVGYDVTINISNSTLIGPENTTSTPILLNVPGKLTMTNCTVNSKWQSVVVRGGEAVLTDCVLNNYIDDDGSPFTKPDYKKNGKWGSGNDLPNAALVVGNRSDSAYRYPASCTLINTEVHVTNGFTTVYAYGNPEPGNGASVYYNAGSQIGNVILGENAIAQRS